MSESAYIDVKVSDGIVIGRVSCPKVAEREAEVLKLELERAGAAQGWRVVLDLSEVMLLASVALGTLVSLHTSAQQAGGRLIVFGMSAELFGMMKITRLHKVLSIVATHDDAMKAVS